MKLMARIDQPMDLKEYLDNRSALVDQAMEKYLPAGDRMPQSLHQSMRYSVFAGGKRLRPILMIAACEAVGGSAQDVLHAACALEMIHTYSLVMTTFRSWMMMTFDAGAPQITRFMVRRQQSLPVMRF